MPSLLGEDVADRLGAGAAGVEGDRLAVEVLPGLVGLVRDREEHEARDLEQPAQRRLRLLHHRIGRADAEIRLAVDDRLDREVLLGEGGQLVVDAALLGALQRDQIGERLHRYRVAERDLDFRPLRRAGETNAAAVAATAPKAAPSTFLTQFMACSSVLRFLVAGAAVLRISVPVRRSKNKSFNRRVNVFIDKTDKASSAGPFCGSHDRKGRTAGSRSRPIATS